MRQKIVDVLCRGVGPDDVARAQACVPGDGNIVAALIEAGFHRKLVLAACTEVTGLPTAPSAWFKDPQELDLSGIDVEYCAQLFCVPIAVQEDRLCVAYADPATAVQSRGFELPRHRAYLATPTKVARALKRLLKGAQRDQTNPGDVGSRSGESSAFSGKARKRKRNAARAASVDAPATSAPQESEPLRAAPPRAAPPPQRSRQDEWEETLRLPASEAQQAVEQALARPASPPAGRGLQVSSHAAVSASVPSAPRGYEPLDPVMPAPSAPPPAPRAPRQKAEAPTAKKKPARQKPPTAPNPASGRNVLLLGSLLVLGVGGVLLTQRAVKRDPVREKPAVVVDGQVAIEARQRPLLEKANLEPNNASAVNQLTNVINLDPATATARDALIARARRYLAAGEVERARRDLLRVQRRRDADAVKVELDKLQGEIGRANMVPSDVRPLPAPAPPAPPVGAPDAGAP